MTTLVLYALLAAAVASFRRTRWWMLGLIPSALLFHADRVPILNPIGGCCSGSRPASLPVLILLIPALLGAALLARKGAGRALLGYCAGAFAPLAALYGFVFALIVIL